MKEYKSNTIEKVTKFFELRFPEKDIVFEKQCGYFWEWCDRFEGNYHLGCSDFGSKKIWDFIMEAKE